MHLHSVAAALPGASALADVSAALVSGAGDSFGGVAGTASAPGAGTAAGAGGGSASVPLPAVQSASARWSDEAQLLNHDGIQEVLLATKTSVLEVRLVSIVSDTGGPSATFFANSFKRWNSGIFFKNSRRCMRVRLLREIDPHTSLEHKPCNRKLDCSSYTL